MRTEKLTIKAQEALSDTRDLAAEKGHAEVTPEHALLALFRQEGGVVPRLVSKVGAGPQAIAAALEKEFGIAEATVLRVPRPEQGR